MEKLLQPQLETVVQNPAEVLPSQAEVQSKSGLPEIEVVQVATSSSSTPIEQDPSPLGAATMDAAKKKSIGHNQSIDVHNARDWSDRMLEKTQNGEIGN